MVYVNHFIFPEEDRLSGRETQLAEVCRIKITSQVTSYEICLDTFDWRIFNAGYILTRNENIFLLTRLEAVDPEISAGLPATPVFIGDFPAGVLRDTLAPVIGVRALTERLRAQVSEINQDCLNSDQKIVCRLRKKNIRVDNGQEITTITVRGLRGYVSEARSISRILNPENLKHTAGDVFVHLLNFLNRVPGDYTSKVSFELMPEMTTSTALQKILNALLHIIRVNEPGLKEDKDTEFLHDYRVAVRRTRSVLSQLGSAFLPVKTEKFKQDFSWLGKLSNSLRDLDVYLLNESRYEQLAPPLMKGDINALFRQLRIEREKEFRKFSRTLGSVKYEALLSAWANFLNSDNSTGAGEQPIIHFVKPIIAEQFARVVERGRSIGKNSADKKLHKLRIECKKLRYLLEFFASLFETEPLNSLIKQLRALQDNLGEFNDYSMQQAFLYNHIGQLSSPDPEMRRISAALGALIGSLYQKQQQVRRQFHDRFTQFASKENCALARDLFEKG